MSTRLYFIPTPIGNLKDITVRALEILASVDVIACEDTRVSQVLLKHYSIETPLMSYHAHNEEKMAPKILDLLREGKTIALISDAGMPLFSDPGYSLVQLCLKEDIPFDVLPGPSAILPALGLSGLPTLPFTFFGFLPAARSERRQFLQSLQGRKETLVFFESPHRIRDSLEDIHFIFPEHPLALVREISKKFQETRRGTAQTLLASLDTLTTKGEMCLVLGQGPESTQEDFTPLLTELLKKYSLKEAVARASALTGHPRRTVYLKALDLKDDI